MSNLNFIEIGKDAIEREARSALKMSERLDESFSKAVECILASKGKVILCGVGKSGLVARKISVTLCSTGTPSIFLHACEAVHGDLGVFEEGNVTIVVSNSGTTAECLRVIPMLKKFNSTIIALLGNVNSPIARAADIVLDASGDGEVDPLSIVPTTSASLAMIYGDALVCALMKAKNFTLEKYAKFHPAGQLGRSVTLTVEEVMHKPDACALLSSEASVREVVIEMTKKPLGAACIVGNDGRLEGIITDGDLRRMLRTVVDLDAMKCSEIMTKTPVGVSPKAHLVEAIRLMEDRPSKISVLPVVSDGEIFVGLISIHDIYQTQ